MSDLEMMALRAQMDPHFIFNCLSSMHIYHASQAGAVKRQPQNFYKFLHADPENTSLAQRGSCYIF